MINAKHHAFLLVCRKSGPVQNYKSTWNFFALKFFSRDLEYVAIRELNMETSYNTRLLLHLCGNPW